MKIITVEFIHPVSCGGSIKTASAESVVGDRPGATPFKISMDDGGFIRLEKQSATKTTVKYVPLSNVASIGIDEGEKPELKKDAAKETKK